MGWFSSKKADPKVKGWENDKKRRKHRANEIRKWEAKQARKTKGGFWS